jgi:hypothetical protein
MLTVAQYESLPASETLNLRKYWKPKLANTGVAIGYERLKEDWVVSTNKIVSLTLTVSPESFSAGDIISQTSTGASATVDFIDIDNKILTVKHVSGAFAVNEEEGIAVVTMLRQNISNEEAEYWDAVNAYDDEQETNELKRNITVLKSSYLAETEKQFILQIST